MGENQIQQFLNDKFGEVRAVTTEDKNIWFVATDIAKTLGLTNISKSLENHREGKDKTTLTISYSGNMTTNVLCVSESGLYKLIFKSRKPFAEEFQDWICEVVIPTIRKDGAYIDGEEKVDMNDELQEAEFILKTIEIMQNKIERLKEENQEMKPKADYCDKVLQPNTYIKLITTTEIAKDLGMSARKLNGLLHGLGVIFKQGKSWNLYSKYQDKVPTYCDYVINEHGQSLKWTELGRKWVIEELGKLKTA